MPVKQEITWNDATRERAFRAWLARRADAQGALPATLRPASADASFRRYFRVDGPGGASFIVMDAPPAREDNAAFVRVAQLMQDAGIPAPRILDWDRDHGFLLLSDLGRRTMLDVIEPAQPEPNRPLYLAALDMLLRWQQASRAGVLPPYDAALLQRELQLFPQWYVQEHRQLTLTPAQSQVLEQAFARIVAHNLAAPQVFVHRDFMPRNLILADGSSAAQPQLGVLDFQDAVHGPVTYDVASLMRDAFLSWDEEFVLDISIRYWERARKLGLLDFEDWAQDFSSFWRAVEWMGLQRHIKVAGIFARITLRDGKPGYLADAPRFMGYIRHTCRRYRELAPLLRLVEEIEGVEPATAWSFGRID